MEKPRKTIEALAAGDLSDTDAQRIYHDGGELSTKLGLMVQASAVDLPTIIVALGMFRHAMLLSLAFTFDASAEDVSRWLEAGDRFAVLAAKYSPNLTVHEPDGKVTQFKS